MQVTTVNNPIAWNKFLLHQPTQAGIFLQSAQWLAFQESLGHAVVYLGATEETKTPASDDLLGICGILQHNTPLQKHYWYSPRGPIMQYNFHASEYHTLFTLFTEAIKEKMPDTQGIFWRFEPLANLAPLPSGVGGYGGGIPLESNALHTRSGRFLIANSHTTIATQPHETLLIDLTQSEEQIFANMHEKTRYNIRLALKKGVNVNDVTEDIAHHELFFKLLKETAKRDKFRLHDETYYRAMLTSLSGSRASDGPAKNFHVRIMCASVGTATAAYALVGYFGDTATYLHGASSYDLRQFMAPYALHLAIIRQSKQHGYKYYDFWGVSEHEWPGVTRFKLGFGGKRVSYAGTFDLPFKKFKYTLYRIARRFRRLG